MDTTEEKLNNELASISDQELYNSCIFILSDICSNGLKNFTMTVPPQVTDSDMLLGELLKRFKEDKKLNKHE